MNREEAINVIKGARKYLTVGNPIWNVKKVDEAFDMAIEALQDRPTGEWIHQAIITVQGEKPRHEWSCSICGLWGNPDMNYCPNCGARMKGGDDK